MMDTEGGPSTPCQGPFASLVFKACSAQSLLVPWHILYVGVEQKSVEQGTGFTGSTKAEKSYTFYCRFSVSVLESTAALEADIAPTSLPHKTLPQTQPQATPKIMPGFAVQTSVPERSKTLT